MVGLSFWEAEACCAWAGGRLPQEEEWEATARGPHGFAYPWGNNWENGICNTVKAGLGVTSPVGLFPRARQSELGIEDLAGNVWEWCDGLYDLHDKDQKDPTGVRVLRGGSWDHHRDDARSARRGMFNPSGGDHGLGFRVVCSSPIEGH